MTKIIIKSHFKRFYCDSGINISKLLKSPENAYCENIHNWDTGIMPYEKLPKICLKSHYKRFYGNIDIFIFILLESPKNAYCAKFHNVTGRMPLNHSLLEHPLRLRSNNQLYHCIVYCERIHNPNSRIFLNSINSEVNRNPRKDADENQAGSLTEILTEMPVGMLANRLTESSICETIRGSNNQIRNCGGAL